MPTEETLYRWTAALAAACIALMLLSGCATFPPQPTYPPHYDDPLIPPDKMGEADAYGAAITSWPPPGVPYYKLTAQPDGRWRYEYQKDGQSIWYPGHVTFSPQPDDPRVPWVQRSTMEAW